MILPNQFWQPFVRLDRGVGQPCQWCRPTPPHSSPVRRNVCTYGRPHLPRVLISSPTGG